MAFMSTADYCKKRDDRYRRDTALIRSLPSLDTFQVDDVVLEAQDMTRISYAFFPGKENRAPCALLAIGRDADSLPQERWRWEAPRLPGRLDIVLYKALVDGFDLLKRSNLENLADAKQKFALHVKKLGIDRDPDTYDRHREIKATARQARSAGLIARCLVHLVDERLEPSIHAIRHDLANAQPVVHLRPVRGYGAVYEPELRRAA